MRILALVPYPADVAPGQRYRMEQWAPPLARLGVEVDFEAFRCEELHSLLGEPGNTWRKVSLTMRALAQRLRVLKRIKDYDLVYIYNETAMVGPALLEHYISAKGVPFVFDFDDAIYLHYTYISPVSRSLRLLKFPGKTGAICRLAAHVIAGNSYLAAYASRFNRHVTVVPSTINTESYTFENHKPAAEPPVIGWTGSYSTVQYLDTLRPVLSRLARRERFKLRVIGVPGYSLEGVEVEAVPWRSETEVADLRAVDIGIMPLPDDEWTRGKCGMKALQYMALGIPCVCSPVGVNPSIIRDGENGLLASTEDEWIERLTRLLHSASLRERLGSAGRATVEAEYASSAHALRVYEIFQSVTCCAETADREYQSSARRFRA
ncbi:MAG: glycosyltransferase family 4 protein [Pyrinomonadaceae bacterium]